MGRVTWIVLSLGILSAWACWHSASSVAVSMLVNVRPARGANAAPPADIREVLTIPCPGASVRAWVFEPRGTPRGTVVVLHGIGDSKLGSLNSARAHAARGYRAVAWDSRGHGDSSGRFLTYGVQEAQDLRLLVDQLEQRGLLAAPLAIVGSSYGAATAIQYGALDARVDRIVAISPFASLREVVPAYLHWIAGRIALLVPAAWTDARIDEAGHIGGFDPDRACPRCVAPKLKAATLIVASRADERIPFEQSQAVYAALTARREWHLVDGAQHVSVGDAPGVQAAVVRWLDATH